jgi:hypothetical protein
MSDLVPRRSPSEPGVDEDPPFVLAAKAELEATPAHEQAVPAAALRRD